MLLPLKISEDEKFCVAVIIPVSITAVVTIDVPIVTDGSIAVADDVSTEV